MVLNMKKWIIIFFFCWICIGCARNEIIKVPNFSGMEKEEVEEYAKKQKIELTIKEEYHETISEGKVIKQKPEAGEPLSRHVEITISKGKKIDYKELQVNELGDVPIMMYHGIQNKSNEGTGYIGGNLDKDGYQRTKEAFLEDLEFYYQNGYRMIRLIDFVNGKIKVEAGKSPIVLTFDDGLNNIQVTGIDSNGEIIIDPNSAVGILESLKEKYPDFGITATFFLNAGLFEQPEYNEKIIDWLLEHGYDIGNHSYSHVDFTTITEKKSEEEIGKMYTLLNSVTKGNYVPIVALPFGSPYQKNHTNFKSILNGAYEGTTYQTKAALRVGWEANDSCFSKDFDSTFLKRIRAYDNLGKDFDITYNFDLLKKRRFISDGDENQITVPKELQEQIGNTKLEIVTY